MRRVVRLRGTIGNDKGRRGELHVTLSSQGLYLNGLPRIFMHIECGGCGVRWESEINWPDCGLMTLADVGRLMEILGTDPTWPARIASHAGHFWQFYFGQLSVTLEFRKHTHPICLVIRNGIEASNPTMVICLSRTQGAQQGSKLCRDALLFDKWVFDRVDETKSQLWSLSDHFRDMADGDDALKNEASFKRCVEELHSGVSLVGGGDQSRRVRQILRLIEAIRRDNSGDVESFFMDSRFRVLSLKCREAAESIFSWNSV